MNYFYQNPDGSEVGPLEQTALEECAANGTIDRMTPVRSSLLKKYKTAGEMAFLADALTQGEARIAEQPKKKNVAAPAAPMFKKPMTPPPGPGESTAPKGDKSTAFEREFTPRLTNVRRRVAVFVTDWLVLALIGIGVFYMISSSLPDHSRKEKIESSKDEVESARKAKKALPRKKILSREEAEEELKKKQQTKVEEPKIGADRRMAYKVAPKLKQIEAANDQNQRKIAETASTPAPYGSRRAAVERAEQSRREQEERLKNQKPLIDTSKIPEIKVSKVTWRNVTYQDGSLVLRLDAGTQQIFPEKEMKTRVGWTLAVMLFFALFYYGMSLGFFAQTFGMWFWGVFLARKDFEEAGFIRCFCFIPAAMLLSPLMIPVVYFWDVAPADMLCGVRVVDVRACPKE